MGFEHWRHQFLIMSNITDYSCLSAIITMLFYGGEGAYTKQGEVVCAKENYLAKMKSIQNKGIKGKDWGNTTQTQSPLDRTKEILKKYLHFPATSVLKPKLDCWQVSAKQCTCWGSRQGQARKHQQFSQWDHTHNYFWFQTWIRTTVQINNNLIVY